MEPIAKQLKVQMEKRGISTHALERMAGLKPSAVQNILYGRSKNPNISTLQAIARALGCPLSEIINEKQSFNTPLKTEVSQKSNQEDKSVSWDPYFYMKCFETVNHLLQREHLSLPKVKVLELVEEVYVYSLGQRKGRVEEYFAEWLIKRSLNDAPRS